jgi:peptidoglycan-associated lipoprotein
MQHQWFRNLAAVVCIGLAIAGCSSTGKKGAAGSLPADEQPSVTAPPQSEGEISRAVDAEGNPLNPQTGMPLGRIIYFGYDKAVLPPESLPLLEMHAAFLSSSPNRRVMIEGNTDERGTREYNLALGERRADAVRTFLVSAGVRRSQIDTVSFGEERPDDPGHDEAAWSKNRRAVLVYQP